MSAKDTALLIEELKVIAESMGSYYIAKELYEAADRLKELEKIADFYRNEADRLASKLRGKEK